MSNVSNISLSPSKYSSGRGRLEWCCNGLRVCEVDRRCVSAADFVCATQYTGSSLIFQWKDTLSIHSRVIHLQTLGVQRRHTVDVLLTTGPQTLIVARIKYGYSCKA